MQIYLDVVLQNMKDFVINFWFIYVAMFFGAVITYFKDRSISQRTTAAEPINNTYHKIKKGIKDLGARLVYEDGEEIEVVLKKEDQKTTVLLKVHRG